MQMHKTDTGIFESKIFRATPGFLIKLDEIRFKPDSVGDMEELWQGASALSLSQTLHFLLQ